MERWLCLVRPLALLVLFAVVVRGGSQRDSVEGPVLDCETAPADVPGLEKCLSQQPDDVELMTALGTAYEGGQQWPRAEALYRRALAVDPEDGDVRLRLGQLLLRRGDIAGARREGQAALRVQPGNLAATDLVRRTIESGQ